MGFFHVAQAGVEFLGSSDLPTLASQSSGITRLNYHPWPLVHMYAHDQWMEILHPRNMYFQSFPKLIALVDAELVDTRAI